jgi:hypothetical protein
MLSLAQTGITDADVTALAPSLKGSAVTQLGLDNNPLTNHSAFFIAQNLIKPIPHPERLGDENIGRDLARAIHTAETVTDLEELSLQGLCLDGQANRALARVSAGRKISIVANCLKDSNAIDPNHPISKREAHSLLPNLETSAQQTVVYVQNSVAINSNHSLRQDAPRVLPGPVRNTTLPSGLMLSPFMLSLLCAFTLLAVLFTFYCLYRATRSAYGFFSPKPHNLNDASPIDTAKITTPSKVSCDTSDCNSQQFQLRSGL